MTHCPPGSWLCRGYLLEYAASPLMNKPTVSRVSVISSKPHPTYCSTSATSFASHSSLCGLFERAHVEVTPPRITHSSSDASTARTVTRRRHASVLGKDPYPPYYCAPLYLLVETLSRPFVLCGLPLRGETLWEGQARKWGTPRDMRFKVLGDLRVALFRAPFVGHGWSDPEGLLPVVGRGEKIARRRLRRTPCCAWWRSPSRGGFPTLKCTPAASSGSMPPASGEKDGCLQALVVV